MHPMTATSALSEIQTIYSPAACYTANQEQREEGREPHTQAGMTTISSAEAESKPFALAVVLIMSQSANPQLVVGCSCGTRELISQLKRNHFSMYRDLGPAERFTACI